MSEEQPIPTPEPTPEVKSNRVTIRPVKPTTPVGTEQQAPPPKPQETTIESHLAQLKQTGTGTEKLVITTMEGYLEVMEPPIAPAPNVGAVKQRQLFYMLKTLLEDVAIVDFAPAWRLVIHYFATYKAFAIQNAYRFIPPDVGVNQITVTQAESFRQIVNLIRLSSDPKVVPNLRQHVDLNKAAAGFKGTALTKLATYYR
jgi:hypothetical protein